jgi:signal transduction histidine kinase
MGLFFYKVVHLEAELAKKNTETISKRLENEFKETIGYVENTLQFMARQLVQEGKEHDKNYILKLLKVQASDPRMREILSSTIGGWADVNYQYEMNSVGFFNHKIDLSNRDYIPYTKLEPGKLRLGKPTIGVTSFSPVIPSALGVADKNGKYVGSFIMGFSIEKLTKKFQEIISNDDAQFVLVNKSGEVALSSYENIAAISKEFTHFPYGNTEGHVTLNSAPLLKGYFIRINNQPYMLFVTFGHSEFWSEIDTLLKEGATFFLIPTLLVTVIMIFFRYRVLRPIEMLSVATEKLSQGQKEIVLPAQRSSEIKKLSRHMLHVKELILKEKHSKEELNKAKRQLDFALKEICDSEKEKEVFLTDMQEALNMPIQAILNGVTVMKKQEWGPLNLKDYGIILDAIFDSASQVENLTTELLKPTKVNAAKVIEKCIVIQKRYASEKNMQIKLNLPANLPDVWADELRLRQIILGFIYHILVSSSQNNGKTIIVSARYRKGTKDNLRWLEIILKDDAEYEEDISQEWTEGLSLKNCFVSRDANMINLSISALKHLVSLHHGLVNIERLKNGGKKIIISIPYLDKEDIENRAFFIDYPVSPNKRNTSNSTLKNMDNVINFPKNKK